MKGTTVIGRYIFREMIPPFLINLILFTFIFLMAKILDITDLVVNYGVGLSVVFLLVTCSMPTFLVFVLPMSTMMGVLLAFFRLSSDNEIVAFKAAGLSIYRLLPPVAVFCLVGCLVTGFMSLYGSPWGRLAFKSLLVEAATSNVDLALKERTFNDSFKGIMLYVTKIDRRDKKLFDVFVEDRRDPGMVSTVVAPRGKILVDPDNMRFRLTLFDGIINQVDQEDKTVHSLSFETYDFNLQLANVLSAKNQARKGRKEMSLGELRETWRKGGPEESEQKLLIMEYHRRFSIPFACFVLGLVAAPIGIQSRLSKQSYGMVLGLFFFLIYYIFLTAGWILGEEGLCPPAVAVWGPNLMIGAVGFYLLICSGKEQPALARLTGGSMQDERVGG
jgi:lipopolysaccharide export system permease protein